MPFCWFCHVAAYFFLISVVQLFSPTGPLNRDYDDVRRFYDAAEKGIKRLVILFSTRKT